MTDQVKKTSKDWIKEYPYKIIDPDGWDRKRFEHSFKAELITKEEFERRLFNSTIIEK